MPKEASIQKRMVQIKVPFLSSPLAVATAAKQGMVSMLKAMKEMHPCQVMPVALIIATVAVTPASSASMASKRAGSTMPLWMAARAMAPREMKVVTTFSLAIRPVIAATAKIQPTEDN